MEYFYKYLKKYCCCCNCSCVDFTTNNEEKIKINNIVLHNTVQNNCNNVISIVSLDTSANLVKLPVENKIKKCKCIKCNPDCKYQLDCQVEKINGIIMKTTKDKQIMEKIFKN